MRPPRIGTVLRGWSEDPLWASVYDWTVEHPHADGLLWRLGVGSDLRRLYDAAGEVGRLPAGARVLDVPCGGGVALRGVRPGQGLAYVAVDIAQPMLDRTAAAARRRGVGDQVETRRADVARLPFADGEFDLVVTFTGLHCFPDPQRAVAEMALATSAASNGPEGRPYAWWYPESLARWKEALTSASASAWPTHSAPSTDLPGSRSL